MTRSDLINSLGVGSRISHNALVAARHLENNKLMKNFDNVSDENVVSVSKGKQDDDEYERGDISINGCSDDKIIVPCKGNDIGGFYSAFCTLATSVEIATKVSYMFAADSMYLLNLFLHNNLLIILLNNIEQV